MYAYLKSFGISNLPLIGLGFDKTMIEILEHCLSIKSWASILEMTEKIHSLCPPRASDRVKYAYGYTAVLQRYCQVRTALVCR